jgi:hypothetical protein
MSQAGEGLKKNIAVDQSLRFKAFRLWPIISGKGEVRITG